MSTTPPFFPGDLSKLKDDVVEIKEGSQYRMIVGFRVQREIVAGLRYQQATYRKGIRGECAGLLIMA